MTPVEQREKNRLRCERWRRAHGIAPRKPAHRPWLALDISRSTFYRRRKQAREREAVALEASRQRALLDRAEYLAADLARDLARCAAIHAVMARELAAAFVPGYWHSSNVCKGWKAVIRSSRLNDARRAYNGNKLVGTRKSDTVA
jgi:hypothetical protein